MTYNLTPWEGRLALLLSLILPLAFSAGCENPPGCVDGDCAGDDDAVNDDDDASWSPVTLRVQVPYEWVASEISVLKFGDSPNQRVICEDTDQCTVELDELDAYYVNMYNAGLWACVTQVLSLDEDDAGQTIVLDDVWEGTEVCSFTPDGTYGTHNVNSGAGWISIDPLPNATATYNTFFVDTRTKTSGILLEGEIAEDLSWIYQHTIGWNDEETEATLPLMDE